MTVKHASAPAIDLSHRLLHRRGWSVGEAGFKLPNGSCYWQVDASKDGQVILATADSQGKAWWECLRLAGVVECEGGYSAKTGGMLLCRSPRSVTAPTK